MTRIGVAWKSGFDLFTLRTSNLQDQHWFTSVVSRMQSVFQKESFATKKGSMMKVFSFPCTAAFWTTLLFSLSLLPSLSSACSCQAEPALKDFLYDDPNAIVMTGRIIGELKLTDPTDPYRDLYYAFKANRVHKAPCTIQDGDLILVSTSASSATCGVQLNASRTLYTLSAHLAIGQNGPVPTAVQVQIGSCDYRVEGTLSAEDRQTIRQYTKSNVRDCNPVKPCATGADCDQKSEYCDAINKACVVIDAPCPTPQQCLVAPCSVTVPCLDASAPFTCINNYCGGCNAIFIDANRTQICNSPPSS